MKCLPNCWLVNCWSEKTDADIPEPGALALAALSGASLLLFRRSVYCAILHIAGLEAMQTV